MTSTAAGALSPVATTAAALAPKVQPPRFITSTFALRFVAFETALMLPHPSKGRATSSVPLTTKDDLPEVGGGCCLLPPGNPNPAENFAGWHSKFSSRPLTNTEHSFEESPSRGASAGGAAF